MSKQQIQPDILESNTAPSHVEERREQVRAGYARVANEREGLVEPGCCGVQPANSPRLGYNESELGELPEGANLGLGCGNPTALAALRPGDVVVDLGSGGGIDCFLAGKNVGPTGRVIGVDMTAEMIALARDNAHKTEAQNVEFRLGEIQALPIADGVADVVISNCVMNLVPDKARAFREVVRILKPGGRIAISDVLALKPIPARFQEQVAAYVGCVAGAITVDHMERLLLEAGFVEVSVEVNGASAAFIRDWFPGSGAEEFVASASIVAVKAGADIPVAEKTKDCCAPTCCN